QGSAVVNRLAQLLLVLTLAAVLGACTTRPSPGPTIVELRISAAEGINPGVAGDGLPVPVRVYRLASTTAFDAATFEEIYHHEMKTLGGHLVGITEFVLFPGQAETITREFNERERYFGILVAYKNGVPKWRASTTITPGEKTVLEARLGHDGVTLDKM